MNAKPDFSALGAERSFLGALLNSPHGFWQVQDRLRSDQFAAPIHREIFSVVRDLSFAGQSVGFQTVSNRLPEEYGEGESTPAYLSALIHNASGLSAGDFAEQIAEAAGRRELLRIGEALIKAAKTSDRSALDHAGEAEVALLEMMSATAPKRPMAIGDLAKAVRKDATLAQRTDIMPGFDTGLPSLDEILGLIMPGDFGAVISSQGDGKTSLATQIGIRAAARQPVLMVQLEMPGEQIAAREMGRRAGLSVREIHEGAFSFDGASALQEAEDSMAGVRFHVLDEPRLTMKQIRSKAIAHKRTVGLGMLIIDHFRLIKSDSKSFKDRFERQAEISGEIKALAKELAIPVIALVQRTRTAQRRDDPTPHIDDADAPAIEQDCDWACGLWRRGTWLARNKPNERDGEEMDKYWAELRREEHKAHVIVLKRRRGKAGGSTELGWIGETTSFCEVADLGKNGPGSVF